MDWLLGAAIFANGMAAGANLMSFTLTDYECEPRWKIAHGVLAILSFGLAVSLVIYG